MTRPAALLPLIILLLSACGGPAPSPDWTVIGPGGGGSTFLPTFSPLDPDTMLLRCDMSGGYLTRDGGQSWKLLNFPGGAQSFALDPADLGRMYVGAGGLHGSGVIWRKSGRHVRGSDNSGVARVCRRSLWWDTQMPANPRCSTR